MDTLCEYRKVGIKRADHNPGVLGRSVMQPDEMKSIESQDGALFRSGKRQDLCVRNRLTASAAFRGGQDIVVQVP
jgi:hypothetical protein